MKNISIRKTEDNSPTLYSEQYKEHYHSTFGAINESEHIFINAGLKQISKKKISIFEMGLGTGLNASLTLEYAIKNKLDIDYHTIEKHPIQKEIFNNLDYILESKDKFLKLHNSPWETKTEITKQFSLHKYEADLKDYKHTNKYDLIYFDAFSPDIQAELWTKEVFEDILKHLNKDGILVTYSVKGIVKRALKSAGYKIEKIPGPKGKREILRAFA